MKVHDDDDVERLELRQFSLGFELSP